MSGCCEHNRCPDRPTRFLRRFRNRIWRCAQCGQLWVTEYVCAVDSGFWSWKEVTS